MAQRHDENYSEKPMTRMGRIQQPSRRYRRLRHPSFTAAIWTANNPLLQRGEIGSEIDTGKLKVGDGVTYWNDLGYVAASEIAFADITGTPDDNVALKNALDAKQDVLTDGTGIDIDSDNVISNTGVRSVATGTTNGTISVNTGGTSAEVSVYGLGSAAYTSSSDYATAAQGTLADNAANKDLSNLTSTGANIANWSSNVSNCIIETPQDIKLELSNGTLTLKAGSKVYVPNGAGVFDVYTVSSDISRTFSVSSAETLICLDIDSLTMPSNRIQDCTSGTTPPSGSGMFYDTSANTIRAYTSGTPITHKVSFPFAQLSFDSGGNCTIKYVFNEHGYIGSTVFALPGFKGLAPNGRNADKTLKSVVIVINSVITRTFNATGALYIGLQATSFGGIAKSNYSYDPDTNVQYSSGTAFSNSIVFASCDMSSGVISNWTVLKNNPFHAVGYSDTEFIAHQATPSNRYVDLTLGASGTTYTAPADGYLTINKSATAAGQYINFINGSNGMNCNVIAPSALPLRLFMPVSKGDVITINYNAAGTTTMFRFIYANGAK
jgi:hypothetical protein